jgi:hypothetical protein
VSRLLLGRPFDEVHRAMDKPAKHLGAKHGTLYHDPISASLLAALSSKDGLAIPAAILHALADEACSRNKALRKLLETLKLARKLQA